MPWRAAGRRLHPRPRHRKGLTDNVLAALARRSGGDRLLHIEDIQDQVELALMRSEHPKVARAYVLYREEHARALAAQTA